MQWSLWKHVSHFPRFVGGPEHCGRPVEPPPPSVLVVGDGEGAGEGDGDGTGAGCGEGAGEGSAPGCRVLSSLHEGVLPSPQTPFLSFEPSAQGI